MKKLRSIFNGVTVFNKMVFWCCPVFIHSVLLVGVKSLISCSSAFAGNSVAISNAAWEKWPWDGVSLRVLVPV